MKQLYLLILRCTSWMVPAEERSAWLREWKAELWHVADKRTARITTEFVAGAFRDAYVLRDDLRSTSKRDLRALISSPVRFLLLLSLATCASVWLAFLFPGVRPLLLPAPYRDAQTLVVVSRDGASHSPSPSITLGEFRYWQSAAQAVFSDLSFYEVVRKELHLGSGQGIDLSIVRASGNLPSLLKSPDFPDAESQGAAPKLVLSDVVWRRYFHADPHIVGKSVFLAGESVRVIGIAQASDWHFPGKPDVWLLESDRRMAALSERTVGFVIARMQPPLVRNAQESSWHMTVPYGGGRVDGFTCTSVSRYMREPFVLLIFTTLMALLALPATTSLPLGEYPYNPHKQSLGVRLRRWLFLAAKLAMILPLVWFSALDLGQIFPEAQYVFAFTAMLAALRWTLQDQRRRCPVCLELLRHPVHVGQPSRNFLAWNGTELICVVGHGFLHVPELPTSWFATQRWLYLDASWHSLFRQPEAART